MTAPGSTPAEPAEQIAPSEWCTPPPTGACEICWFHPEELGHAIDAAVPARYVVRRLCGDMLVCARCCADTRLAVQIARPRHR